jgi:hypothetical protein
MGFLSSLRFICTFDGHLDLLQEGVHFDIDSVNGTNDDGAVFELDCDGLIFEFH